MALRVFWLFLVLQTFISVLIAQTVTVSFQHGVDGYSDARDTKLLSANSTTNYGSDGKLELDGSPDISSLLYWDLSSIPPGSAIQSVDIVVNITNSSSQSYELYQLLRLWVESEATWNQYRSGQSWQVAGADGSGDRSSTVLANFTGSNKELHTISLNPSGVAVVQSWVDDPATNHGFILLDYINNSNGLDFSSRETGTISNRPKLVVSYDSNSQPFLDIDDVTVTEGDGGTVAATFTVSLFPTSSDVVTADYTTTDGSATTADNDYDAIAGQVSFQPGVSSRPITVVVNGDLLDEPNETFFVNLSNALNANINDNQGTGTILNDDGPLLPDIAVSPVSHDYGDVALGMSASQVFVVNNSGAANLNVLAATLIGPDAGDFSIESGGGSFVLTPGSVRNIDVSFMPGSAGLENATLRLTSNDPDEDVLDVSLSGNGVSSSLPGELVTFSVSGDYPYGSSEMAVLQRHMNEHNLYSPSDFYVHVGDFFDQNSSCPAQGYLDAANLLKTLAVPVFVVIGDNDWTDCSNPSQGFQRWFDTFAFFENNFCGLPAVEHQDVRPENWAFVTKGVLLVGINNPGSSAGGNEREIRLQDDADWVDFQFQDKAAQIRAAIVFGHAGPSGSESLFFDQFEASSITVAKPVFYIHGHDHHWQLDTPWSAPNMQRLIVTQGGEEDPVQITVTMDMNNPYDMRRNPWSNNPTLFNRKPCVEAGPDQTVSQLDAATLNGVATDDGVPTNPGNLAITWSKVSGPGSVIFGNANSLTTSANFTREGTYGLRLTADDGELTSSDELIVQVQDTGPVLTIDDISIDEGNSGTVNAVFTVTLSATSSQTVTVNYATANGTATAGSDYVAASGQVTFQPGQTSRAVTVVVNGDVIDEPDETFFVNLSNAVNAAIADNQGMGTISDDDGAPSLSVNDVTVTEGNSGTVNAAFTVTLSATSSQTVTVNYATANGTATVGSDYVAASGQVTFQPGQTSRAVTVVVNGDVIDEPDETFFVNLSNAVNAAIADNQSTGTITDDDGSEPSVIVSFQDGVNGYNGTRDTKLMSQSPTLAFGTAAELELDGSPDRSALLSWDLASISPGSVVQSADITVNVTNSSSHGYEFYEMLRSWVESEATWNQYASGQSWQVAGADGAADRSTTVLGDLTAPNEGLNTLSLNSGGVALIQSWVDNPASNRGFIILDYINASNGLDFSSRERSTVSERPKLTVTYSGTAAGSGLQSLAKISGGEHLPVAAPDTITLDVNYPNPFNLETCIKYGLPEPARVRLAIYNIRGQQVRLLVDEHQEAGFKDVRWDGLDGFGREVGSGVYFVQLFVERQSLVTKLSLQK